MGQAAQADLFFPQSVTWVATFDEIPSKPSKEVPPFTPDQQHYNYTSYKGNFKN